MSPAQPIFTAETFRFFRDLAGHNHKEWMDLNRERYKSAVVVPFRRLLEAVTPAVLDLDPRFDTCGRTGTNFSRINRDTRFAKDKTPYRAQMYLKLSVPFAGEGETGQLYAALSAKTVTAGFRIYAGGKRTVSALAQIAAVRLDRDPRWLRRQRNRLARRYRSYWYSSEKGRWMKHQGWPGPQDWRKLQGWVVRRSLAPAAATRKSFPQELQKVFRDLFPLLRFTSID